MRPMLSKWGGAWTVLLLVLAGITEAAGVLPSLANRVLTIIVIAAGLGWALLGSPRSRRLAELYLWLAFILPFGPLNKLSQLLGAQIEKDQVTLYVVVTIVHLGVVVAALTALGAWKKDADFTPALARRAAALLIIAAVIFWSGAMTWPGMELREIAARMRGHMWTSGTFLLAAILTLGGLLLLTLALRNVGDRVASSLGLAAYLFGATFWAIHLAVRLTVMPWAAQEFLRSGAAPPWYEPWRMWSGMMFGLYSLLAYAALAAYGAAVLRTRMLPRWAGWTCIVFAVLNGPFFGPPLTIHVMPWMLGILILRQNSAPFSERREAALGEVVNA